MTSKDRERSMVKLSVYLYRECARTKQEGVLCLNNPPNDNRETQFDYLDEIPRQIRQHLRRVGLAYEVAEDSDNTVIAPKAKRSRVVRKIRLEDVKRDARALTKG